MLGVRVSNLTKGFGGTPAVDDVSFDLEEGRLLSILGPSGSGKTTLLRCIAGIEKPEKGSIQIGGRLVFDAEGDVDVPPEERGLGMVFQAGALWPHMTVRKNVAYPLEIRGDKEADPKVDEVLKLLNIEKLDRRYPSEISGGEQQRVAIARAIVYRPSLVLLDEPFSSLDAPLRESLRDELRQLQLKLGMSMLYVTHERVDALSLGDLMLVLSGGRVLADGPPTYLLKNPPNSYTARFLGGMLVLDADLGAGDESVVSTKYGKLPSPAGSRAKGRLKLCVPPSAITVDGDSASFGIPGTVTGVVRRPSGSVGIRVSTEDGAVELSRDESHYRAPGEKVLLSFDPQKCLLLES